MQMNDQVLINYIEKNYKESEKYLKEIHDDYRKKQKFCWEGKQWDEIEYNERIRNGRRTLTINMLPRYVNQILNDARLSIPTIKIKSLQVSETENNETKVRALDAIVSHIQIKSNAQTVYSTALKCAISGGIGFYKLGIDYLNEESFDVGLMFERIIDPTTIFYDVNSESLDASDWSYCIIKRYFNKQEFKIKYDQDPDEVMNYDYTGHTIRNREMMNEVNKYIVYESWIKERVPMLLFETLDGRKMKMSQSEFKEQFGISAKEAQENMFIGNQRTVNDVKVYVCDIFNKVKLEEKEWPGKNIPIVPIYGEEYISTDNKRKFRSAINDSMDPQIDYNVHRSAVAEMEALQPLAPLLMPKGSIAAEDKNDWEEANRKPKVFLEFDPDVGNGFKPTRMIQSQISLGERDLAAQSSNDLKETSGLSDANLGRRSNEVSGRAILARQRKGEIATYVFNDSMKNAMIYTGRCILEAIPHVYNNQQSMKIVGRDFMGNMLNKELDLKKLDFNNFGQYDVYVEIGYGTTTQRDDIKENLLLMMERLGPEAASIVAPKFVQLLNFPGADDVAKLFETMLPPKIQNLLSDPKNIEQMDKEDVISMFKQIEFEYNQMQEQMQQMQQQMEIDKIKAQQEQEKIKLQGMIDTQQLILELQTKLQIAEGQNQTQLTKAREDNARTNK